MRARAREQAVKNAEIYVISAYTLIVFLVIFLISLFSFRALATFECVFSHTRKHFRIHIEFNTSKPPIDGKTTTTTNQD